MKLSIVTATTNPERARRCLASWETPGVDLTVVVNGRAWTPADGEATGLQATWVTNPEFLGTVSAFKIGVSHVLQDTQADLIACFHDDVEILDRTWADQVVRHFTRTPACGLAGFGGAIGLGSDQIYQSTYNPMQLARAGFRSNLIDAEVHGLRSLLAERVACLDGFSQIGRRAFWSGWSLVSVQAGVLVPHVEDPMVPWDYLESLGLVHHIYDGALGCVAARLGWEAWYIPVRCRHYGGQTAVGDVGYQEWAKQQHPLGDQGFWEHGHQIVYDTFRDVLPLRV